MSSVKGHKTLEAPIFDAVFPRIGVGSSLSVRDDRRLFEGAEVVAWFLI